MKQALLAMIILMAVSRFNQDSGKPFAFQFNSVQKKPTKHSEFDKKNLGYILIDLAENSILESHNADQLFLPASTLKVLTTAVALKLFGDKHRFETELSYNGKLHNGTLTGNLYLTGRGDMSLRAKHLYEFVEKLQDLKIKSIAGSLVVDESYFPSREIIDQKMGVDKSYNQSLSALTIDFNSYWLRWRKNRNKKKKKEYEFRATPDLGMHRIITSARKFKLPKEFRYQLIHDQEVWFLSKNFIKKYRKDSRRMPSKRAALFTGKLLQLIARKQGIQIAKVVVGKSDESSTSIHIHKSKPLGHIIEEILNYSNNMLTDTLLMHIGKHLSNKTPDLKGSAALMKNYIAKKIIGVDFTSLSLLNGSGLSSRDFISPRQLAAITLWASHLRLNGRSYLHNLSISGAKGTLLRRFFTKKYAYRVYAKTGGIYYSVALTGFFFAHSGKKYLFTIFYNDQAKRKYIDNNNNDESRALRKAVFYWGGAQRSKMDARIKQWITNL